MGPSFLSNAPNGASERLDIRTISATIQAALIVLLTWGILKLSYIQEAANFLLKHIAFNSQSARVVILLGEQHDLLWNIVKSELKKIVPAETFKTTEEKINGAFLSGYGSILYFEDMNVIEKLQQQFPTYHDAFPVFSNQSAGMLQFVIWTALEQEGFGASLQHYNPVIDDAVKSKWSIPDSWKLLAQMPFGKPVVKPGEKEFQPLDERVKIYK